MRLLHNSPYLCYIELREYGASDRSLDDAETLAIMADFECVDQVERDGFPVVIDTFNRRVWCGQPAVEWMRSQHVKQAC